MFRRKPAPLPAPAPSQEPDFVAATCDVAVGLLSIFSAALQDEVA